MHPAQPLSTAPAPHSRRSSRHSRSLSPSLPLSVIPAEAGIPPPGPYGPLDPRAPSVICVTIAPLARGYATNVTTPTTHPQNRSATLRRLLFFALAAVALVAVLAACDTPLTTFEPRSDAAQRVHTIYIFVIVAASIVGFLVLAAMAWILWRYRERPGHTAQQIHGNTTL